MPHQSILFTGEDCLKTQGRAAALGKSCVRQLGIAPLCAPLRPAVHDARPGLLPSLLAAQGLDFTPARTPAGPLVTSLHLPPSSCWTRPGARLLSRAGAAAPRAGGSRTQTGPLLLLAGPGPRGSGQVAGGGSSAPEGRWGGSVDVPGFASPAPWEISGCVCFADAKPPSSSRDASGRAPEHCRRLL